MFGRSHVVLDLFCWGDFLATHSISLLDIGLLRFSVSSESLLVICVFVRICPFLVDCLSWWYAVVHSILVHISTSTSYNTS